MCTETSISKGQFRVTTTKENAYWFLVKKVQGGGGGEGGESGHECHGFTPHEHHATVSWAISFLLFYALEAVR